MTPYQRRCCGQPQFLGRIYLWKRLPAPIVSPDPGLPSACPGGETGKSGALKRRCPIRGLRVRIPPRALDGTARSAIGSRPYGARGADRREGSEVAGGHAPLHALRRPSVLHLRRLQGGGHRDRRRPPRADGDLCGRGVRQGDAGGRGRGADRGAGRDQRGQRDRRRPGERLADLRARRPRPGDALGGSARCRSSITSRSSPRWSSRPRRSGTGDRIAAATAAALDLALAAPSGPTFVDYPLDVVFSEAGDDVPARPRWRRPGPRRGRRGGRRAARRRRAPRRDGAAPGSTGAGGRASCGRWPRRWGSRSSSTAWAAAASPPTTS